MLSTKFRFLPSGFSPAANDKIFCTDSASKAPSIFDISRTGKKSTDPQVVRKGGGQKPAPLSCDVSYKAEEGNADNNGQPGHWEHESRFRWLLLLRSAAGVCTRLELAHLFSQGFQFSFVSTRRHFRARARRV